MDLASVAATIAIVSAPPAAPPAALDFDAPAKDARTRIDSRYLMDQTLAAMAQPYKYGVTQMPCSARDAQPARGWHPAREPAGRIEWVRGPVTTVKWSGIYGTCYIVSPHAREAVNPIERAALECECNGWLPSR